MVRNNVIGDEAYVSSIDTGITALALLPVSGDPYNIWVDQNDGQFARIYAGNTVITHIS
jgi:hypothetical protein